MPGRNINDQQVRTYMRLRTDHPQTTAAAKAGLSVATARRIDLDPRPPSTKKQRRTWRTRPDPLEGLWEEEILPLLVAAPGLRPITLFDEMERRHPERISAMAELRSWRIRKPSAFWELAAPSSTGGSSASTLASRNEHLAPAAAAPPNEKSRPLWGRLRFVSPNWGGADWFISSYGFAG